MYDGRLVFSNFMILFSVLRLTSIKNDFTIELQLNMRSMFFRKEAKREAGVNPARSRHCDWGA